MKRIMSFLCAAAILAAAVLCGCGSQNSSSQSSGQSSQAAEQTTAQPVTDSPVKTTGGKVHISDSTLGDIWISELEGVAHNKLSADGFTSDANFKYYSENGSAASQEGIDISSFCGEIDWAKVREAGIDFAMVRLGGRSYGDKGDLYTDDKALSYIQGARDAGIKVGGYFFSQATTTPKRRRKRNTPTIFSATSSSTIPLPMTGRSSRTTAPAPTA
nr:GH25 family lysozyme [uncultured Ruminococcus sp.]